MLTALLRTTRSHRSRASLRGAAVGAVAICAATCLLSAGPARLALAAPGQGAEAKQVFRAGQKHFKAERYDKALAAFERAYKLKPLPDILFMVGQAQRNLKRYGEAIRAFEGYLEGKPDAPDRDEVRRLIEELQFLMEASGQTPPGEGQTGEGDGGEASDEDKPAEPEPKPLATQPPPKVPPSPAPRRERSTPVYKTWWFWTIVAVGAAGAGVGGYFIARSASGEGYPEGGLGTLDLR